ncbi:MAG: ABC transporter ATP-binding protein [Acidobacteria bacterium]|nr:ABC transporter ATP-binding protein [Acidobacteriota bacterium]
MIEVKGLSKRFGDIHAVREISFSVEKGEIFGFLGPNGAGKTTSIHMMCGLLTPDSGSIIINGEELRPGSTELRRQIGFVPQETALYPELSATENLRFWGGLYGLKKDELDRKIEEVLQLVELSNRAKDKVGTYSGGMQKRVNLAAGVLHNPDVVFMDEPTAGVDPQGRFAILNIIRELAAKGKAIIYTTHYMDEAQKLCDRIAIMDFGEILGIGNFETLRDEVGKGFQIFARGDFDGAKLAHQLKNDFEGEVLHSGRGLLAVVVADATELGRFVAAMKGHGVNADDLKIKETDLETVFLKLTGRELRD